MADLNFKSIERLYNYSGQVVWVPGNSWSVVLADSLKMSLADLERLQASLPDLHFVDATDLVRELRMVKSEAELCFLQLKTAIEEFLSGNYRSVYAACGRESDG